MDREKMQGVRETKRSASSCSILSCKNNLKTPGIQFYRFPKSNFLTYKSKRREEWINLMRCSGGVESEWVPDDQSRVCSAHFIGNKKSEDSRSPSYNPSIFNNYNKIAHPIAAVNRYKFQLKLKKMKERKINCTSKSVGTGISMTLHEDNESTSAFEVNQESVIHDQVSSQKTFADVAIQQDFEELENDSKMHIFMCNRINSTSSDAETQVYIPVPKKVHVILPENNKICQGFHGVISIKDEQGLLDLCGITQNAFDNLNTILSKNYSEDSERKMKISVDNRLLIFLIKMKCVSKIFYDVLDILSVLCTNYVYWPPKAVVQETVPECFKPDYSNCRVIIDSTEFIVEQPPEIEQRCQFYSNYKKGYRIKVVVGCTPSGLISFKSKCFGGRATDSQITVSSGLLNLLEPGDIVLADKGFPQIKSMMDSQGKGILLVMPPFNSDGYFNEDQCEETYNIARVRIHIERIMQRIRVFRINEKFTLEMLPHCDKIIHMCCVLVNLQPPILKSEFTS